MKPTHPTDPIVIVSAEGFGAGAELTARIHAKADKLHRHHSPAIGRVRVHLKRETPHEGPVDFAVCVTAETSGPDFIAHGNGEEPEFAVNSAFTRLERTIAASAGMRKHDRHAADALAAKTPEPLV